MRLAVLSCADDRGARPSSSCPWRATASSGTVLAGVKGPLRRAWQTAARPALDAVCAPCNPAWNGVGPSPAPAGRSKSRCATVVLIPVLPTTSFSCETSQRHPTRSGGGYFSVIAGGYFSMIGSKVALAKLQPQHVQHMMNDQLQSGLSPNTVLRIRATLRRALNQAVKWGLITRNVATLVDPPKAEKFRVEAITPEEATAILDAVAEDRLAALHTLLLGVGLRLGEGLGLKWEDVDLNAGVVTVRRSLQKLNGKFDLVEPKTESSRRTLPLPSFVVTALKRHQAAQEREQSVAGEAWENTGLVFTTNRGKPLDNSGVHHRFERLLKYAGVRQIRLQDLRHGCASLLLAKGVSPRVVMETLGHSQISLTMNTYAHVIPALQRDAADRMDEVFTKPAAPDDTNGQLGSELGSKHNAPG